jgi:hypothetical protein
VRGFSSWLQTASVRGALHRAEAEAFDQDRAQVRAQLRSKLGETLGILTEYNESFDQLFRRRETARAFSSFMLNSRRHFWQLGNNLNGIYHVAIPLGSGHRSPAGACRARSPDGAADAGLARNRLSRAVRLRPRFMV